MGTPLALGLSFGQRVRDAWDDIAVAADELGFESLFMPDHLVLPTEISGELVPGEAHPPLDPQTPMWDAPTYLAYLAGRTSTVKLGTMVYLLGMRHPFATARAFATLDHLARGRAVVGVGAGWLTTEWTAAELDPRTRGARLDEAIEICRRLWAEPVVSHEGTHFSFGSVCMEPRPSSGTIPIHVGGESKAALNRAARLGDGWLGMFHTPESAKARVHELQDLREAAGRADLPFEVTVATGPIPADSDLESWIEAGITRLIVAPWGEPDPVASVQGLADRFLR